MLIHNLFTKWSINPKGIIHIGAHMCEEYDIYKNSTTNIIWIEANPYQVTKIKTMFPLFNIYQAVISNSDTDIVDFIITNNIESSSILELFEHKNEHPDIHEIHRIKLNTITLPTFLNNNNIDISNYDFLVMDIQGAEYLALQGMSDILHNFNNIYLEVNIKELYKSCGLLSDIQSFLLKYDFYLRDIQMTQYGWGDALFSKKLYKDY
jgi:FkbM family methyltransferase